MISLATLNDTTVPVVLIENFVGDEPLIADVYCNRRTRSSLIKLKEASRQAVKEHTNAATQVDELRAQLRKLDNSEAIAVIGKQYQEAVAANDAEQIAAAEAALKQLEEEQAGVESRVAEIQKIIDKIDSKTEARDSAACKVSATTLTFFIKSLNVHETEAENAPRIEPTMEWYIDTFDNETLIDFMRVIAENLSGPLGQRGKR